MIRHGGNPALDALPLRQPPPRLLPQRGIGLAARVRAASLDREFTSGIAPWRSPLHAARAIQLTAPRSRRSVARSLERLIEHAERGPAITAAITPCRTQVSEARPAILRTAARLRSDAPIDARGVARIRALLSDGAGPCYVPSTPQALTAALETAERWLQAPD
jgi:hypothetical protein